MDENSGGNSGGGLPPKLDLRKSGVLKSAPIVPQPAVSPSAPVATSESIPDAKPIAAPDVAKQPLVAPMNSVASSPQPISPKPIFAANPAGVKLMPKPTVMKPVASPAVGDAQVSDSSQTMRVVMPDDGSKPVPVLTPAAVSNVDSPKPALSKPIFAANPAGVKLMPKPTVMKPVASPAVGDAQVSDSSQTMRVVMPDDGSKPVPVLTPAAMSTAVKPMLKSVMQPAGGIGPTGVAKKETSKIPLGAAKAVSVSQGSDGGAEAPKTIRIKPTIAVAGALKAPGLSVKPVDSSVAIDGEIDEKRKTSRISLEAALGSAENGSSGGPKTIKLKRPSEAPTVKAIQSPFQPKVVAESMSKTARIDAVVADDDEGSSPTRRKTIKVKRPTQRQGVQMGSDSNAGQAGVAGSGHGAPPAIAVAVPVAGTAQGLPSLQPISVSGRMHWVFPVFALVTVLVVLVTIYMFAAQAFGPNVSLSQLSYGAPNLNLPWPGKISIIE